MLGFPQIVAGLALGYILGGIAAVVLLALRIKSRKDPIPFGPALVIGTALLSWVGLASTAGIESFSFRQLSSHSTCRQDLELGV